MNIKRRRTIGSMISLASMADIAFLLLVFFVVTSAIGEKQEAGIKPPYARAGEKLPRDLAVTLLLEKSGRLSHHGRRLNEAALRLLLADLKKIGKDISRLQVSGDRGASYGQLAPFLEVLKKAGVREVVFAAVQGKDE